MHKLILPPPFQSPFGSEIIEFLKADRIFAELNKIEFFLRDPQHLKVLNEIREVMRRQMLAEEATKPPPEVSDNDLRLDLSALTARLTLNEQTMDTKFNSSTDMVKCWDIPGTTDLNHITSMKQNLLRPEAGDRSLRVTLDALPAMIEDMPGEFFLQPPYLYRNLFQLLDVQPQLTKTIQLLNRNLLGRIKFRQLAATYRRKDEPRDNELCNQIAIAKYVKECFQCVLRELKANLNKNTSTVNRCLAISTQLVDLAIQDPYGKTATYDDVMQELSALCRYFRNTMGGNENKDFVSRKYYLEILNDLVRLMRRRNSTINCSYNPGEYQEEGINEGPISRKESSSWTNEIQVALLDVSIKIIYQSLYDSISAAVDVTSMNNSVLVSQLLQCEDQLRAAVNVLRDPTVYCHEDLIYLARDTLETLSIHESTKLVFLIVKAISSSYSKFTGDVKLRLEAEAVLLKLLSYPDTHLKRIVYQEKANQMKLFFTSLVDGERSVAKMHKDAEKATVGVACNLGLPITVEILTEILCVGYPHNDGHITAHSESILTLIIKGRSVLGRYWKTVQKVLIPVLPLLQSITNSYSSLSKSILEMFDPDPMELPYNDILQGNIRFMFNEDASIRSEALVRLMYIVDSRPEAKDYTPDIRAMSDAIHDDVCVLEGAVDVTRRFCDEGHFDETAIYSLVNLLKDEAPTNSNTPMIRKSALMQLNSMAADSKLNAMMHDLDAWYSILIVIDNGLKVANSLDAPESVVPAVNLFCKWCIQFPEFRKQMAKEMKILMLLIRALCKYQHMAVFRPDCVLALFLLVHSDFIEGSVNLSAPLLFSKLLLPLVAKSYHWTESPYYQPSRFEAAVVAMLKKDALQASLTARSARTEPTSLYDFKLQLSARSGRRVASPAAGDPDESTAILDRDVMWQFLRVSFACLWFKGFDRLLENSDESARGLNYDGSGTALDFNEHLKVIRSDLSLIQNTMPGNAFNWSVRAIQNATRHKDVVDNLMILECVLRLNPNVKFNMKSLAKSLERFCLTIPNSLPDESLFGKIVTFLTAALDSQFNDQELQTWLIKEFKHSHCNFVSLLSRASIVGSELYRINARFVKKLLASLIRERRMKHAKRIALLVMNHVLDGVQEQFLVNNLANVNTLVAILRTMLMGVPDLLEDYSEEFAVKLTDRLLAYSVTSKITSSVGSNLLKNTLVTILHLGRVIAKFRVDVKHLNLIIGLTGHVDLEIRTLAWNLMEKLSSSLDTARLINAELKELPGGLHNFVLSTAMDEGEVDLVREVAGVTLANLLSHVDQNGQLMVCPAIAGRELGETEIPWDLVVEVLNRHQFIDRILEFVMVFSPSELVDIECEEKLSYCGTIRGFVAILHSLLNLDDSIVEQVFFTSHLGVQLMNVVNVVPADVTPNTLELAAEICKFLIFAQRVNETVRERIILSNRSIVAALVYLLNVNVYKNYGSSVNLWSYGIYFLEMLRQIIATEQGFLMLCQVLERNENGRDFVLAVLAALQEEQEGVQLAAMEFIQVAFSMNFKSDSSYLTLVDMMDLETMEEEVEKEEKKGKLSKMEGNRISGCVGNNENLDPNRPRSEGRNSNSRVDLEDKAEKLKSSSLNRVLFHKIHRIFRMICASKNGSLSSKKKTTTFRTLAILLNASSEARAAAKDSELFLEIVQRFRETNETLGMSCQEFVRRHGEPKKAPIVEELELLFDLLIGWFAVESLLNVEQVERLSQVVLKFWSWIAANQRLQIKFVRLLVLLSEDSVPVCKSFASQYSSVSPSVVQLVTQMITQEMSKVKHPKFNLSLLRGCIRVLINCCCCVEGRLQMGKLGVMEHMDRLHPQVTKWQEPWLQISDLWLEFWEVYSRYAEGGRVTHLSMLFSVIQRGRTRQGIGLTLRALTILRNMSFLADNRVAFLNSEDYINMLKFVLDSEKEPSEHLVLVIVSIWKLLGNSFKAKNKLNSTTIPSKLVALKNRMAMLANDEDERRDEILMILDIVNTIFVA